MDPSGDEISSVDPSIHDGPHTKFHSWFEVLYITELNHYVLYSQGEGKKTYFSRCTRIKTVKIRIFHVVIR
jgi:hypothetical protein